MLLYFGYSMLSFFKKRKLEQMRCFADDLQGVLDTQLENKLIADPPKVLPNTRVNKSGEDASVPLKRKKAENAGKPWSEADDRLLCEMFDAGCSQKDLAKNFMRSRNSIAARLVKLGKIHDFLL